MTQIFVTLLTDDLDRSRAFYTTVGGVVDPALSGDDSVCIRWDDNIAFMVGRRQMVATLTDRELVDPRTHATVLLALSRDSREAVDAAVEAGVAAGGTGGEPQDYGFMYARDLEDPDGNGVQLTWMPPADVDPGTGA